MELLSVLFTKYKKYKTRKTNYITRNNYCIRLISLSYEENIRLNSIKK